ncbi:MAG: hypothetical protein HY060_21130 [Proteobacteria bacterium]|nr:hypothetical protein [Pseudomonadota bacterium]
MSASSRRASSADHAVPVTARGADEEHANALIHAGGLALAALGGATLAHIASSSIQAIAAAAFAVTPPSWR